MLKGWLYASSWLPCGAGFPIDVHSTTRHKVSDVHRAQRSISRNPPEATGRSACNASHAIRCSGKLAPRIERLLRHQLHFLNRRHWATLVLNQRDEKKLRYPHRASVSPPMCAQVAEAATSSPIATFTSENRKRWFARRPTLPT
jgi:hypothetical protein